jgi:hypothetical protein
MCGIGDRSWRWRFKLIIDGNSDYFQPMPAFKGLCCSEFAFGEANTSAVSISRYGGAPVIFTAEEAVGLKSEAPRTREWRGFEAAIKNNESLVFCRSSARVERQTDTERLMSRRAKRRLPRRSKNAYSITSSARTSNDAGHSGILRQIVEGCAEFTPYAAERRSLSKHLYRPGDTHCRPMVNHRRADARKACRQTSPGFLHRA